MKIITCKNCGNKFERDYLDKRNKYYFCSKSCAYEFRRGVNNPNHKESSIKCDWCGKMIKKSPSQIKKHNFCSWDCYCKWSQIPENNPNYKDGSRCSSKIYYCIEDGCNNVVKKKGNRCIHCGHKKKDAKTKKVYYCECGNKISYNCALYGTGKCNECLAKIHSERMRNRGISNCKKIKVKCSYCLKIMEILPYRLKRSKNFFCSKEHYGLWKKRNTLGKNNSNWKGGKSFEPYPIEWNSELREQIRKRDNYQCQLCQITEEEHLIVFGRILSVHHIDYDKQNCREDNLITLCLNCNTRVNSNRTYWVEFFKNKFLKLT